MDMSADPDAPRLGTAKIAVTIGCFNRFIFRFLLLEAPFLTSEESPILPYRIEHRGTVWFSICPTVATVENASSVCSMVQLGADHLVRTSQLYVSFGRSQHAERRCAKVNPPVLPHVSG